MSEASEGVQDTGTTRSPASGTRQRPGSSNGAGGAPYLSLGGLYQQSTLGRQANLRVQDSHPGSVPVALTPEKFLVSEPGQSSQMTPVGASQVHKCGPTAWRSRWPWQVPGRQH